MSALHIAARALKPHDHDLRDLSPYAVPAGVSEMGESSSGVGNLSVGATTSALIHGVVAGRQRSDSMNRGTVVGGARVINEHNRDRSSSQSGKKGQNGTSSGAAAAAAFRRKRSESGLSEISIAPAVADGEGDRFATTSSGCGVYDPDLKWYFYPNGQPLHGFELYRTQLYSLFNDTSSSLAAMLISIYIMVLIVISTATFCIESYPWFRLNSFSIFFHIETFVIVNFTIEYCIRFVTCPNLWQFVKQPLNLVDILAILPYYVELVLTVAASGEALLGSLAIVRIVRLARIFRIFKFSKYSSGFQLVVRTMRKSGDAFLLMIYLLVIVVVFAASAMHYAEISECKQGADGIWRYNPSVDPSQHATPFVSIPHSMWWAVVTLTTVGYGIEYPRTPLGMVIASFVMVMGVIILAFPITIIGSNFQQAWGDEANRTKVERRKRALSQKRQHGSGSSIEMLRERVERLSSYFVDVEQMTDKVRFFMHSTRWAYTDMDEVLANLAPGAMESEGVDSHSHNGKEKGKEKGIPGGAGNSDKLIGAVCKIYPQEAVVVGKSKLQLFREQVFDLFSKPQSSRGAWLIGMVIMILILVSTISFCLETLPVVQWDGLFVIESVAIIMFTIEYMARLLTCKSIPKFVVEPLNIVDLVAIIPYYVELSFSNSDIGSLAVFRVIRLARVFRLFKFGKQSKELRVVGVTLKKSAPALRLMSFLIVLSLVLLSSIEYFAEQSGSTMDPLTGQLVYNANSLLQGTVTRFNSIPETFWWCMATMTTVGYGDAVPLTLLGRLFAVIAMIVGILVIAFPVTILGAAFDEVRFEQMAQQKSQAKFAQVDQVASTTDGVDGQLASDIKRLVKMKEDLDSFMGESLLRDMQAFLKRSRDAFELLDKVLVQANAVSMKNPPLVDVNGKSVKLTTGSRKGGEGKGKGEGEEIELESFSLSQNIREVIIEEKDGRRRERERERERKRKEEREKEKEEEREKEKEKEKAVVVVIDDVQESVPGDIDIESQSTSPSGADRDPVAESGVEGGGEGAGVEGVEVESRQKYGVDTTGPSIELNSVGVSIHVVKVTEEEKGKEKEEEKAEEKSEGEGVGRGRARGRTYAPDEVESDAVF